MKIIKITAEWEDGSRYSIGEEDITRLFQLAEWLALAFTPNLSGGYTWQLHPSERGKRNMDSFWMVYVEGKGNPMKRHATRAEAEAEAERLARKEGKPAFVLRATEVCQPSITSIWHLLASEMPFNETASQSEGVLKPVEKTTSE